MLSHRLLLLAILPVSLALPSLVVRDAPDATKVEDDIVALQSQVNALNDTVNSFTDGNDIDTALMIQEGAQDLYYAITNTTKDVNASQPYSEDDSTNVAIAFLTADPDILALIDNIKSKKPVFDEGFVPFDATIVNDLEQEKAGADELAAALSEKLSGDLASAIPGVIAEIDQHFDDAIAVYRADA